MGLCASLKYTHSEKGAYPIWGSVTLLESANPFPSRDRKGAFSVRIPETVTHPSENRSTSGPAFVLYDEAGGDVENIEKLIVDLKDSLEREIAGLRQDMQQGFAQVNTRFDTQAVRMDRHAGLWQTGTRWSSRMDAWAEKVDAALDSKDREIADLNERGQRIERGAA